jgi:excisionase family DNA binding protein
VAGEYLTLRAAARRVGVHENTIRNWATRGLLQPVQVSGTRYRRFRADDVDQLAHQQQVSSEKARRNEGTTELVDADYLDAWAASRAAEELLPALVGRLLDGTAGVRGVHVRTGDGIRVRGWDGIVEDSSGMPWVPAGPSAWEFGAGGDPGRKADDDYMSRTSKPLEVEPSVTTFVFVTPRRWPGARAWEHARRAEGRWRNICALDADDLAAWLRSQPSTHVWFSEQVGLQLLDVLTLSQWWERFRRQTEPPIPPELLLAGRHQVAGELLSVVQRNAPSVVYVRAASTNEAIAFIASVFETSPSGAVTAVVAASAQAWERLATAGQPSVLVPLISQPHTATAVGNGHCVVVPLAPSTSAFRGDVIEVGPLDRNAARDALVDKAHLGFARADRLAGLARRSFASFLRSPDIAAVPRSSPSWARGEQARLLSLLTLAGAWELTPADLSVIASIAARDWPIVEESLIALSDSDDPPFIRSGGGWQVVSPDGVWALLQHAAQPADIARFSQKAVDVLTETDPMLALDKRERLLASVRGVQPALTLPLRLGVAQGLALLGTSDHVLADGHSTASYADSTVSDLLRKANDDPTGLLWRSLSRVLQLIAEAAPDAFLDAVDVGLVGDDPVLRMMFSDADDGGLGGASSEHTDLLWALELLCWSPDHFSRAAGALARLAEIDPSGQLANRPAASLRAVFLPWFPQTSAPLPARLEVLDVLRKRHPRVAWSLEMALLPSGRDFSTPTPRPRYRQWPSSDERPRLTEWLECITEITRRATEDAGRDPVRWRDLIGHVDDLPAEQRDELLKALRSVPTEATEGDQGALLWRTLVDLVARHREFADAPWALDEEALAQIETVARLYQPSDAVARYAHLFDWRPHLPNVDPRDSELHQREVSVARTEAVRDVIATLGFRGIQRLAEESKVPEFVGQAMADAYPGEHFSQVRPLLRRSDSLRRFAHGWVARMAAETDPSWLDARALEMSRWSVDTQLGFLLALGRPTTRVVTLVDSLSAGVQRTYWETVLPVAADNDAIHTVADRLLRHDRPWIAVDLLSVALHGANTAARAELDPDQIIQVLERCLKAESADPGAASRAAYDVGMLLDYIEGEGISPRLIAGLEWSFFRVLERTRQPRALFRALSEDPHFFVDLVCRVYRPKNQSRASSADERTVSVAQNAWSVLRAWRPRLDDQNGFHTAHLISWVQKARLELAKSDRADIGDHQIGQTLSGLEEGLDGIWPPEVIRELIEDLKSANFETGLTIGILNSRGVTFRGVYDGGAQEWALASKYRGWSQALGNKWPRTAQLLRRLADDIERLARRGDLAANDLANES